jgi:hypothetical protein
MPDETPSTPPQTDAAPEASSPPSVPTTIPFDISAEFGTAKRNLPPAKIVGIALACVLVIVAIYALTHRAKPQGAGSIDNVASVEISGQNQVMTAVNITVRNTGEKPLWIHDIKATLKTDTQEFSDESASAVDFQRYFQAFPALGQGALAPMTPETKIPVGGIAQGTVIFSFPVSQDGFDKRKSLTLTIQPYDQPLPVVLTR